MRAVLDAGRGTLTLPRRLLPVVMLLGTRGRLGDGGSNLRDLVELERAGIAPGRRLHPLAADMLSVVTDPRRVVTVEVSRDEGIEISTIWARQGSAVLGRPAGDDLFQLGPVEVGLLPFHLAQLTGVRPQPEAPFSGSVTVPSAVMDGLADTWSIDIDLAVAALIGEGVEPAWAERLAIAHRHRRSRWRIAALWITADGSARDDEMIMLDAGPGGYWEILADPHRLGQITFVTRRFVDVLELLHAAGSSSE